MSHPAQIIMGIDPGNAITGYGFIKLTNGRDEPHDFHCGAISSPSSWNPENRLKMIYEKLDTLIKQHRPEEIAVEELFFNKNTKTALSVGEARGIALLCAAMNGIPVFSYTPLQVKQAIVGYGRATKDQVLYMVRQILNCRERISPDDAADALAIAICHSFRKNPYGI
ncbi:MAG TPA: crossover junction endodeoxyribonuclease RuvC [Atribacteraceae bacterium]|nr:crossover junction endodeoxyribonuclease RuvC [Atribacteraceae bacterium]